MKLSETANVPGRLSVTALQIAIFLTAIIPIIAKTEEPVFYETDFSSEEGFTPGSLDGQDGWSIDAGNAIVGANGVVLTASDPRAQISRDFERFYGAEFVALQFRIRGGAGEPPAHSPEASSPGLFYAALAAEGDVGKLYLFDGKSADGGEWRAAEPIIPLDDNGNTLSAVSVMVLMDFKNRSFDVLIDGEPAGFGYGFQQDLQKHFLRFVLSGNPDLDLYLESFSVEEYSDGWLEEPAEFFRDSFDSGKRDLTDGRDLDEAAESEDPPASGHFFEIDQGRKLFQAERSFDTQQARKIWLTTEMPPGYGKLPDPETLVKSGIALVAVNPAGFLFAWDELEEKWINSGVFIGDREAPVRVDLRLDFETGSYWVCVDQVLVLRDLGFRDQKLKGLESLQIQADSEWERELSSIVSRAEIAANEPANLDFSGDGLTNDQKRALGLDVFKTDTTGDGIPDWWLVARNFDATDPEIGNLDPNGKGLTIREDYLFGTRPEVFDADGDGWSDFEEYLAGTDPNNPELTPEKEGLAEWTVAKAGEQEEVHAFRVGEEYRLIGTGIGTHRQADSFTFVYQEVTGDFEAVARIQAPEHLEFGRRNFQAGSLKMD